MADKNVRFIRIRGRIVPIRSKGPAKPRDIGVGERAGKGLRKGIEVGGSIGVFVGGLRGGPNIKAALGRMTITGLVGAAKGGALGAGLYSVFGARKTKVRNAAWGVK